MIHKHTFFLAASGVIALGLQFPADASSTAIQTSQENSRSTTDQRGTATAAAQNDPLVTLKEVCDGRVLASRATGSDSENAEQLAQVETVVVDLAQGRVTAMVLQSGDTLGFGGERRIVPFAGHEWSTRDDKLVLRMDRNKFSGLEPIEGDLEQAVHDRMGRSARPGEAGGERGRAGEAGGRSGSNGTNGTNGQDDWQGRSRGQTQGGEMNAHGRMSKHPMPVLLKHIEGRDVHVQGQEDAWGEIDGMWVDPKNGDVCHAIISVGGLAGVGAERYPVPFSALQARWKGENGDDSSMGGEPQNQRGAAQGEQREDRELHLSIDKPAEWLKSAPTLSKDENSTRQDREFLDRVDSYWGVEKQRRDGSPYPTPEGERERDGERNDDWDRKGDQDRDREGQNRRRNGDNG